eukprot:3291699-Rhodomonas_salina.1
MARGLPGRLKVCWVRGSQSLAFGKVLEADDVIEVNGQSVKGMTLAEVMAMLEATRVSLKVERTVGGSSADYWQASEVLVKLVDQAAESAARKQALRMAGELVDMLVDKALDVNSRRFHVERWGVVLRRGAGRHASARGGAAARRPREPQATARASRARRSPTSTARASRARRSPTSWK